MKKILLAVTMMIASLMTFTGCDHLSEAQKEALIDSGLLVAKSFGKAAIEYHVNEWLAEDAPPWAIEPTNEFLMELQIVFDNANLTPEETTDKVNDALLDLDSSIREDVRLAVIAGLEDSSEKTASNPNRGADDPGAKFLTHTTAAMKRTPPK